MAAAAVGGAAIAYGYHTMIKKPAKKSEGVASDGKKPTKRELINDTDITSELANLRSEVEGEASKDILALRQQLRSSLSSYDISSSGSLADIRVGVKGSDKIYGFSAFPVSVNVYAPCPSDPEKNKVHIQRVTVYVKDTTTGNTWWKQTWTGDKILRNSDYTWDFILKTPDPYYGKVKSIINNNNVDKKTLEELLNSDVNKFEVCIEVRGYREVWIWKRIEREDGTVDRVLHHERDDPVNVDITSLSAWMHITTGKYKIDGTEGSLPLKFADKREYTAYKMISNGAVSNLITRTWATPVHTFDSSADYKFVFLANPDYFDPLEPVISDDVKIVTLRTQHDGSCAVACQLTDNFGDLGSINSMASSMNYKTSGGNAVSFDTYVVLYATVESEYKDFPIWIVAKPSITVLSNKEVIFSDERVSEIASILEKEKITEKDIKRIRETSEVMKSGFEDKKQSANALKAKCGNNNEAKKYAEKSIEYYNKAVRALDNLHSTGDPEQIAILLKQAKNYEMIADYYADASEKALYGQIDQAKISVGNAQKIEKVTKQYEPSIWFGAGSALGDVWQSFKEGFGIGAFPDWALILVAVVIVLGIAVIVLKIL